MRRLILICVSSLLIESMFGQDVIQKTIYFEANSIELDSSSRDVFNEIVECMESSDFSYLKIFGFATTPGTEDYNLTLSEKRAKNVYRQIKSMTKIDESRFYMDWLGESNDIYDLHFDQVHAQEACVEVLIQNSANSLRP